MYFHILNAYAFDIQINIIDFTFIYEYKPLSLMIEDVAQGTVSYVSVRMNFSMVFCK